jgi:hypothetical protein
MPKVRLLAATSDKDGNPLAAGQVVDVDDETAAGWRSSGLASALADEQAAEKAAKQGNYGARTGRGDVAPLDPSAEAPGPQSDEPKKGKK